MTKTGFVCALVLLLAAAGYGQETTRFALPQLVELGRSVQGRPINAIIYGSGKTYVLVLGGIHGDERATAVVARAFSNSLLQEAPREDLTVIIVPEVNPDGLAAGTRVNANGVDINRSFPARSWQPASPDRNHYPGTQPATEPETSAIMQLLARYPPVLLVTFHAALGCVNWDGPADELAKAISLMSGYPLCPYLGYETPGSLGQYVGRDRNIPAIAIELGDPNDCEILWSRTLHFVLASVSTSSQ